MQQVNPQQLRSIHAAGEDKEMEQNGRIVDATSSRDTSAQQGGIHFAASHEEFEKLLRDAGIDDTHEETINSRTRAEEYNKNRHFETLEEESLREEEIVQQQEGSHFGKKPPASEAIIDEVERTTTPDRGNNDTYTPKENDTFLSNDDSNGTAAAKNYLRFRGITTGLSSETRNVPTTIEAYYEMSFVAIAASVAVFVRKSKTFPKLQ